MDITCSIIISVLESYEVVNRQLKHFNKFLPDNVELIIIDDGSIPAISNNPKDYKINLKIIQSGNFDIPWSQPLGRNLGAKMAEGDILLMSDIDHILTKEAIDFVLNTPDIHKIDFPRTWGVLDESGNIVTDIDTLIEYGLDEKDINKITVHYNTFAMPKSIFNLLGGYDKKFAGNYGGDDVDFSNRYGFLARQNEWKTIRGPLIYVYCNPRLDKKCLFHSLRRKSNSSHKVI